MSGLIPAMSVQPRRGPEPEQRNQVHAARLASRAPALPSVGPNALVRWAFLISIFAIPFARLYLPGTGERLGVTRIVQVLLLLAVLSQPRICLRLVPQALYWFLAYCLMRLLAGFWLSPEWFKDWWPSTLAFLQFFLPWLWFMFNVLQYPAMSRQGLWAFILGCSLCASLHIAGFGTVMVSTGLEGRSSVFGENANVMAITYAIAIVALVGLGMLRDLKLSKRLLVFPLVGLIGIGLAKTGSRTGAVLAVMGMGLLLFQAQSFVPKPKRYLSLLLVGAVLAGVIYQIPTVLNRFQTVKSVDIRQQEARARMIPVLWEIFLRSPVYGTGPDSYQFELTRRAMPSLLKERRLISSHNLCPLLLVETGLLGFLLFSMGWGTALLAAWRARHAACGLLPLALLLPLIIAGFIVSNPIANPTYWLVLAYSLAGRS